MLKKLLDGLKLVVISVGLVVRSILWYIFVLGIFWMYLWIVVVYFVILMLIFVFVVYYLKVVLKFLLWVIIGFEVVWYLGVFFVVGVICGCIDWMGVKLFLLLLFGFYVVVGMFWWVFLWSGFGGVMGIVVVYVLLGMGVVGWMIVNLGYLLKIVLEGECLLMVLIYGVVMLCLGGCVLIVWGWFLKMLEVVGMGGIDVVVFGWFFVSVVVSVVVLILFVVWLLENMDVKMELFLIGSVVLWLLWVMLYLVSLIELLKKDGVKVKMEMEDCGDVEEWKC